MFSVTAMPPIALSAAHFGPTPAVFSADKYLRTELYFGMDRNDGSRVTDDEWNKFLASEVTARFPNGLTVVESYGQYRLANGSIAREKSRLVIILYKKKDRESAGKNIDEIRKIYCDLFRQESVLRVDLKHSVAVTF